MQAGIRRATLLTVTSALTAACAILTGAPPTLTPTPTLTLALTLTPTPLLPGPTASPRVRSAICQFPVDYDQDNQPDDAGIYRFDWQGPPVNLRTGAGPLTLTGPADLQSGSRDLILIFTAPLSPDLALFPGLPPGGAVVYDPARRSTEFRNETAAVLRQRLDDPARDGLYPINQDIVEVERIFGPGAVFTVTLTVRGRRGIRLDTQYEAWRLFLGDTTYEYQVYRSGATASLLSENGGPRLPYDGPVSFDGRQLTYQFTAGAGLPFSAASYTTAVQGDQTATFPAPELERLYRAAYRACGP